MSFTTQTPPNTNTGTDTFSPSRKCTEYENLADFCSPLPPPPPQPAASTGSFPAVFLRYDKIADSLKQVNLALARYNEDYGPAVFRMDGHLVWVLRDPDAPNGWILVPVDRNRLRILLSEAGTWKRFGKDDICEPDNTLLDAAIAAPTAKMHLVPVLRELYPGVLIRSDGTVVCSEGYDPVSGYFCTRTSSLPPVPEIPSAEEVAFARSIFDDLFGEFLFAGPGDAANAVAAVVTAILRPLFPGPVPICAVDKNTPRAGGSLLSLVIGTLAYGSVPMVYSASRRRDEMEKIVQMTVRDGQRFVILDNVTAGADWAPEILLSATSGSGRVCGRTLGTSESFTAKTDLFFVVNGVHLQIRADVTGRMFCIRLMAPKAWQEMRFRRTKTELLKMAEEKHPQAVWAVAVLLRSWQAAGEPAPKMCAGNISEFPEWYRIVCGMLEHAGYTDVLANQGEMQAGDNEADAEGTELLTALYAVFRDKPFTAKGLMKVLVAEGAARKSGEGYDGLLNYMDEEVIRAAVSSTLSSVKVGLWLKRFVGTRFAGAAWFLEKAATRSGNSRQYFLRPVEQQGALA